MITAVAALPWPEPVFRLSVAQYHAMIKAGVLTDDDPVELLEGILVFRMPKNPPHETAVGKMQDELPPFIAKGWHLRLRAPVTLADSEPEPDGALVRGSRADYSSRHPGPSEILLVIEVADTTLDRDRGIKLRSYARAGIAAHRILNLVDRQLEVYSEPTGSGDGSTYRTKMLLSTDELLPAILPGSTLNISVGDLLP